MILSKDNVEGVLVTVEGEIVVSLPSQEFDILHNAYLNQEKIVDALKEFGFPGTFMVVDGSTFEEGQYLHSADVLDWGVVAKGNRSIGALKAIFTLRNVE